MSFHQLLRRLCVSSENENPNPNPNDKENQNKNLHLKRKTSSPPQSPSRQNDFTDITEVNPESVEAVSEAAKSPRRDGK